jgi:ABC-type uncharacterized transport system substrate-binding protein
MRRLASLALILTAASVSAIAGDYDALMAAIKKTWPDKHNVAVVCDQGGSKNNVQILASAANGMKILLIDVKGPQDMGKALGTLSGQKPDLVVLIAGDKVAGDGSPAATFLIQRMAGAKVPVAATTEAGVKQGAVVAVGPGTGGKLLVNAKAAALSGVSVPEGGTAI